MSEPESAAETQRETTEKKAPRAQKAQKGIVNRRARQRALVIAVLPQPAGPGEDPLAELKELLRTAGVATAGELVQVRDEPDPSRYFGRGKLAELKRLAKESNANVIASDDELLPRQERNLEAETDLPVIDRTSIILDIFATHAHSAEGKLQVELAQLEYNMARMRGLWTHLERLAGGGVATRGPGETQIETDRRLARNRIALLKRRLGRLDRNRGVQRAERERSAIPRIALAGYTNAGKSTLMHALTGADVEIGDRLFHTLDPTTRSYRHEGREYLLTDTVGFIRKLPHQLVESFKATLDETRLADLLVHVVDGSAPAADRYRAIEAVNSVLDELGATDQPRLLVYNKLDLMDEEERSALLVGERDVVGVSAISGEGIDELRDAIARAFEATLSPVDLLIPYSEGAALSQLHKLAGDLERTELAEGVAVHAKIPTSEVHRFEHLKSKSNTAGAAKASAG